MRSRLIPNLKLQFSSITFILCSLSTSKYLIMPKIVSRSAISTSNGESYSVRDQLIIYYCLCGDFALVIDKPISLLAKRPVDNSFVIRNVTSSDGKPAHTSRFNAPAHSKPVYVKRQDGIEAQYRIHCTRCELPIGYETQDPKLGKGPASFIFQGAVTDKQMTVPDGALDEETVIGPVRRRQQAEMQAMAAT